MCSEAVPVCSWKHRWWDCRLWKLLRNRTVWCPFAGRMIGRGWTLPKERRRRMAASTPENRTPSPPPSSSPLSRPSVWRPSQPALWPPSGHTEQLQQSLYEHKHPLHTLREPSYGRHTNSNSTTMQTRGNFRFCQVLTKRWVWTREMTKLWWAPALQNQNGWPVTWLSCFIFLTDLSVKSSWP